MTIRSWRGFAASLPLAAALAALTAVEAPAAAQVMLHAPQEISNCLCLERSVANLANDVLARNRIYEERRRQLDQLESDLAAKRSSINVNDPAQVEQFRQLLDKRNEAVDRFAHETTPDYSSSVEQYNRKVADYNAMCSGKSYDPDVLATVKPSLSCPAP
ncbi:MAG TPA: hypothetical protein VGD08_22595 [Stellaceae bacterium]|jgi:hypothetical protein